MPRLRSTAVPTAPSLTSTAPSTFTTLRRSLLASLSLTTSTLRDSLHSPYIFLPDSLATLHEHCLDLKRTAGDAEMELEGLHKGLVKEGMEKRWGRDWVREARVGSLWEVGEWLGEGLVMGGQWREEARRELVEVCENGNGINRLTKLLAEVVRKIDVEDGEVGREWKMMKRVWDEGPFYIKNEDGEMEVEMTNLFKLINVAPILLKPSLYELAHAHIAYDREVFVRQSISLQILVMLSNNELELAGHSLPAFSITMGCRGCFREDIDVGGVTIEGAEIVTNPDEESLIAAEAALIERFLLLKLVVGANIPEWADVPVEAEGWIVAPALRGAEPRTDTASQMVRRNFKVTLHREYIEY